MYLMKASGATYQKVLKACMHAFHGRPSEIAEDEFVLLSKNSADCAPTERQVQFVAKVFRVRPAEPGELNNSFPGVQAGERWEHVVELYWPKKLDRPFNLTGVRGFNGKRYGQVQAFAKLDPADELPLLNHLVRTNPAVLLDIINNAERPDAASS
jgi:hypothetical protein